MTTLNKLSKIIALLFLCEQGYAVDFNLDLVDAEDKENIDLTKFVNKGYVLPGKYLLDMLVNNKAYSQESIEYHEDAQGNVKPCVTKDLLRYFLLQDSVQANIPFEPIASSNLTLECAQIEEIPGINISNVLNEGKLKISIPQSVMQPQYAGWTPHSLWSNGIPAIIVDYNINNSWSQNEWGENEYAVDGYGVVGANLGAWRFRANYNGSYRDRKNSGSSQDFKWTTISAYRSIPKLHAVVSVGELYLNSNLFDSFKYRGIGLKTDERMLPPSIRGYAPTVSGIAKTNAKVTIRQDDHIVYETTVPPGPFVIRDLSSSLRGKLYVTITEENGSTESFQQFVDSLPYLSRPGMLQYNLAVGEPIRTKHEAEDFKFFSGDFSYGVGNQSSVYGGAVLSDKYKAYALGLGRDLGKFGTASIDVTRSTALLPDINEQTGFSYRINYSKKFEDYNSLIQFSGYRFSEEKFTTMAQFMNAWRGFEGFNEVGDDELEFDLDGYLKKDKELYIAQLSKTFYPDDKRKTFNANLSYSHQTYWNDASNKRLNLSVSKNWLFKNNLNVATTLNAYQNKNSTADTKGIMFSVSIPLDSKRYLSYSSQFEDSYHSNNINYYQTFENTDSFNLALNNTNTNNSIRGNYQHKASMANINVSASANDDKNYNASIRLEGGLTVSQHGFVLHPIQNQGATRILVDTGDASGVPLSGTKAKSNFMGLTAIDTPGYFNKDTKIDFNTLPDDIESKDSVRSLTVTEGGVGYVKFDVLQGQKRMFQIEHQNSHPPFGATAVNEEGKEIGIVSEDGYAYLAGLKPKNTIEIQWGNGEKCSFKVPNLDEEASLTPVNCK